jgi:hypothetical protein
MGKVVRPMDWKTVVKIPKSEICHVHDCLIHTGISNCIPECNPIMMPGWKGKEGALTLISATLVPVNLVPGLVKGCLSLSSLR